MKRRMSLALAALILQILPAFAQDVTADTVVATVNGEEITIGHMIVLRDGLPDQYKSLPDETLFRGILDQLTQQTVLAQSFDGLDYAIGLRLDNEARALRAGAAINAAIETRVTEEALEALYQEKYASIEPEREFNASHILVETEEEALDLIAQLGEGADFAVLAQEHSTGPSGPSGGALGWFSTGMMVKPFEDAVVGMEVDAISAPVQTQFGWHVIRLNETRQMAVPTLDAVREDLLEELRQISVEETINDLMEDGAVEEADLSGIDPAVLRQTDLVER